jgi:hypothetical protein
VCQTTPSASYIGSSAAAQFSNLPQQHQTCLAVVVAEIRHGLEHVALPLLQRVVTGPIQLLDQIGDIAFAGAAQHG